MTTKEDPTQTGASSQDKKPEDAAETTVETSAQETSVSEQDTDIEQVSEDQAQQDAAKAKQSDRDRKMAEAVAARNAELTDFESEARTHPREHEEHNARSSEQENNQNLESQEKLDSDPEISEDTEQRDDSAPGDLLKDLPIYMKDGVPMMKLVVSGEELELPVDRVRGIAQKNFLADNRLRKVAETEKSLAEREAEIQRREKELQESKAYPPESGVKSDVAEATKSRAMAFVQTLFNGTEEEAIEKAVDFLASQSTTSVDSEALRAELEKAAEEKALQALERREQERVQNWLDQDLARGVAIVERDYPDVLSDEVLYAAADGLTDVIQDNHPDWSPSQVLVEAARQVTERFSVKPKDPEPSKPTIDVSTQRDRKADLKPVPQSRSNARFERPKEPEVDMSPEAVIERMKASRNQIAGRA